MATANKKKELPVGKTIVISVEADSESNIIEAVRNFAKGLDDTNDLPDQTIYHPTNRMWRYSAHIIDREI